MLQSQTMIKMFQINIFFQGKAKKIKQKIKLYRHKLKMVKALNLTKPKNKMKKPLKKKRQRCIEASCFTNHKGKHEQFDIF